MTDFVTSLPVSVLLGLFFLLGAGAGYVVLCSTRFVLGGRNRLALGSRTSGDSVEQASSERTSPVFSTSGGAIIIGTAVLFAAYGGAYLLADCQQVAHVAPRDFWRYGRIVYHLVLIGLLVTATVTDLRDYVIPDQVTLTGMAIGLLGATVSGDLQMVHLWIDWNQADRIVDGTIQWGPFVPGWIAAHPHWHGLAWSAAGLTAGAGTVWLVRLISSLVLGRETMGLGDVTLMGMIGTFIGWQPVCFVFLLAPACGLLIGLTAWLAGRTFVAFGPYLALATFVVLVSWRWLWHPTRYVFGHPPSLGLLAGIALAALIVLLVLLRLYRAIPVERRRIVSS